MKTQFERRKKLPQFPAQPISLSPYKKSHFKKWMIAVLAPTMGLLIACGKSNTNEIDKNNAYQNCSNCSNFTPPGSGNEFLKAAAQDQYGIIQLNLSLMSQVYGTSGFNAVNGNYATFVTSYGGMVAAVGNIVLNQNFTMNTSSVVNQSNNTCLMPQGTYNVRTIQAGQWSGGQSPSLSSMRLELMGPAYVTLSIPVGRLSSVAAANAVNATGRLQGNAVVETINGNPCQIIFNIQ